MSEPLCVLCGKKLNNGQQINREHYVPQVLIRNFRKLRIPQRYTHALRIDLREDDGEVYLAPISCHKEWATVKVHVQCNLDASGMCQDFKYIIDHIDQDPTHKTDRILKYYSDLWGVDELGFSIIPDKVVDDFFDEDGEASMIYDPGYLWIGKFIIQAPEDMVRVAHDYEQHTIYLGTEKGLTKIIDDMTK
jgi:hypothetical protein